MLAKQELWSLAAVVQVNLSLHKKREFNQLRESQTYPNVTWWVCDSPQEAKKLLNVLSQACIENE
ncbi:MAG: hypothetical protein ACRCV6_09165 [Formosimonas sp.]